MPGENKKKGGNRHARLARSHRKYGVNKHQPAKAGKRSGSTTNKQQVATPENAARRAVGENQFWSERQPTRERVVFQLSGGHSFVRFDPIIGKWDENRKHFIRNPRTAEWR